MNSSWLPVILATLISLTTYWAGYASQLKLRIGSDVAGSAQQFLFLQIPQSYFALSAAAMSAALFSSVVSFIFESTPSIRRLALLTATIQFISYHCDTAISDSRALVIYDRQHGVPLVPLRYLHWGCTTPLIVIVYSLGSGTKALRVAWTAIAQAALIALGFLALSAETALLRGVYSALSMVTFVVVLWRMYTMLKVVPGNPRKGSSFFLTVILWTVYPLVFYSSQFGLITFKQSEICLLFVNFFAKALLSTSLLYLDAIHNDMVAAQMSSDVEETEQSFQASLPRTSVDAKRQNQSIVILNLNFVGVPAATTTSATLDAVGRLFVAFDRVLAKYSVSRADSSGTEYVLAAGHIDDAKCKALGAPADRILRAAQELLSIAQGFPGVPGESKGFTVSIGVHCGNAISGMLTKKQRHLSFLGEAVSTAAAIQAVGQPDAIHLTGEVLAVSSLGAAMFSPLAGCFIDGVGIINTCFLKVGDWETAQTTQAAKVSEDICMKLPSGTSPAVISVIHSLEGKEKALIKQVAGLKEDLKRKVV